MISDAMLRLSGLKISMIASIAMLSASATQAQRAPVEVAASVVEISGYAQGGCFLDTIPEEPISEGMTLSCHEYTWSLTNTTSVPIRSIEISDDFGKVLAKRSTETVPAEIIDIRATYANGVRAESFSDNVFVAVADLIPANSTVAIRLRAEIKHAISE